MKPEKWESFSSQEKSFFIQNKANTVRGVIINAFIALESYLIDIVVNMRHNGVYGQYITKYGKQSKVIIDDFINCYDDLRPQLDQFFTNKEALKSDLENLASVRNKLAHFVLVNDPYVVNNFDGNTFYFIATQNSQELFCSIHLQEVDRFQSIIVEYLKTFSKVYTSIHPLFSNPPKNRESHLLVDSCQPIIIKKIEGIKK